MEKPKLRKIKYPFCDEVKKYLKMRGMRELLNTEEEMEQPVELDQLEQSVITFTKNLLKRESNELKVLQKFYKKIQPYYEYYGKFMVCKKGCGCCCYIHVDVTQLDIAFIDRNYNLNHENEHIYSYSNNTSLEHKKCPFLKEGVCSVYESRPFVCRNYCPFPDDDGICSNVKNFGKDYENKVILQHSPNIEYSYYLISQRFCKRKNLHDFPIDLKKYYTEKR